MKEFGTKRVQSIPQQSRIIAEFPKKQILTAAQVAFYKQAVQSFAHMRTLANDLLLGEQEHELSDLTASCGHLGTIAIFGIEKIYRIVCESPQSKIAFINVELRTVAEQCEAILLQQ